MYHITAQFCVLTMAVRLAVLVFDSQTQVEMLKRRVAELEEENRRLHAQARAMQWLIGHGNGDIELESSRRCKYVDVRGIR